jgi:DNA-binding MarR family transcriptional regulator
MGVSYFACDGGCGTILNDCERAYTRLHHEASKGEWVEGTYCADCAKEIKSERYAADPMNVLVIRKRQPTDVRYRYETLTEISRPALKSLICAIKDDYEVALQYKLDMKMFEDKCNWDELPTLAQICEASGQTDVQFCAPQEAFNDMILGLSDEQDAQYWEIPPKWPDAKRKRVRLEDRIRQLDRDILQKQAMRDAKKAKLDALQ